MAARRRKSATVLACLFVIVLLSCVVWMSANLSHSCNSDYCPICAQLEMVGSAMRRLCFAGLLAIVFAVIVYRTVCLLVLGRLSQDFSGTLVSLKVKLSD